MATAEIRRRDSAGNPVAWVLVDDAANVDTSKSEPVVDYEARTTLKALLAKVAGSLVPANHDYISLTYTGENLTGVVYKTGGAGGTTVATLALAYSGSNLISVTRT